MQGQYSKLLKQRKTDPNVILLTSPEIAIEAWQKKYWAEHQTPGQPVESPRDAEECCQMPPPSTILLPKAGMVGGTQGQPQIQAAANAASK